MISYLHPDHLGSPRIGTDSARNIVWQWQDVPFGTAAPTGSVTVALRYPGQYHEVETGLFQNWHRTYEKYSGRYVESDSIGIAGGLNTYSYVGGNPVSRVDPLGLEWQLAIGVGGSLGGSPVPGIPGFFGGGGLSIGFTSSGQIIIQGQATGSLGLGIFGGVGAQGQVSETKCPTKPGISIGQSLQGDFNFGAGPSVGGSIQYDGNSGGSLSTGVGKLGVGYGLQVSGGVTQTVTIATPALFPSNAPCGCQ